MSVCVNNLEPDAWIPPGTRWSLGQAAEKKKRKEMFIKAYDWNVSCLTGHKLGRPRWRWNHLFPVLGSVGHEEHFFNLFSLKKIIIIWKLKFKQLTQRSLVSALTKLAFRFGESTDNVVTIMAGLF